MAIEPYSISITHHTFDMGGNGTIKAVLISDIHAAYDQPDYFATVVRAVQSENPDIILIAGDSVEGHESDVAGLKAMGQFKAPYGVFAVLGNHDYRVWRCGDETFASRVVSELNASGIIVLRNENRILDIRSRKIALIGVDDPWACNADYLKASAGVPVGIPKLILVHEEGGVPLDRIPEASLVVSGHTHCGQVRIPFLTDIFMDALGMGRYNGGSYNLQSGASLYVTCGVTPGVVRFLAPPEVSVLEIK